MSGQTPKIISIGKATQDVFLRSDEFDPRKEGEHVYTHIPLGIKMEVDDIHFRTGGNATNVAVTFARQGLEAAYMWGLGDDPAAEAILRELDNENVDTQHVVVDEHFQAGYSVVLIATNGERTILNHRGNSFTKSYHSKLNLNALKDADWVYPTSLGDKSLSLLREIIDAAKEGNIKVMLNPAQSELDDPAKLKSLLHDVEVICMNKEEMHSLVHGETLEELVRHGLNLVPVVIVSDGPNGVVASDGKTLVRAGMYEDVKVVDRLGAGDAFASGFLSQWAQGKSLKESIVFASANSTSVVTQIGAKPGILPKGTKLHDMPLKEEIL